MTEINKKQYFLNKWLIINTLEKIQKTIKQNSQTPNILKGFSVYASNDFKIFKNFNFFALYIMYKNKKGNLSLSNNNNIIYSEDLYLKYNNEFKSVFSIFSTGSSSVD